MDKSKYTSKDVLRIMELVTRITVARERNEARDLGDVNALVGTLFRTMCELYEEAI